MYVTRAPVPRQAGKRLKPQRARRGSRIRAWPNAKLSAPCTSPDICASRDGRARRARRETLRLLRLHGLPARLRQRPAGGRARVLRVGREPDRVVLHAPLRGGAVALGHARGREHLLRQLQPALRLLPELPDQPGLSDPEDERGFRRAARGDDAVAPGAGLPQRRLRFADAFAPQMARAVLLAARGGLRVPIVYNTNAYDSVEVLRLLEGVVDVYLPDFKYADTGAGLALLQGAGLSGARAGGPGRDVPPEGLAPRVRRRGAAQERVARARAGPANGAAGVSESLSWIAETLSPRVAISLMAQYYPIHRAATNEKYAALNRSISDREWGEALGGPRGERPLQRLPAGIRHGQPLLPSRLPRPGNAVSRHPGLPIAPDGAETLRRTPGGEGSGLGAPTSRARAGVASAVRSREGVHGD